MFTTAFVVAHGFMYVVFSFTVNSRNLLCPAALDVETC